METDPSEILCIILLKSASPWDLRSPGPERNILFFVSFDSQPADLVIQCLEIIPTFTMFPSCDYLISQQTDRPFYKTTQDHYSIHLFCGPRPRVQCSILSVEDTAAPPAPAGYRTARIIYLLCLPSSPAAVSLRKLQTRFFELYLLGRRDSMTR